MQLEVNFFFTCLASFWGRGAGGGGGVGVLDVGGGGGGGGGGDRTMLEATICFITEAIFAKE